MIVTLLLRDGAAAGRFGGAIAENDATLSTVRLYTRPRTRRVERRGAAKNGTRHRYVNR